MPISRLRACLPCVLLLTGCATKTDYPVYLNVQVQGTPMHTTVVHGGPGHTESMKIGTIYVLTTRFDAQPDGHVVATTALTEASSGAPVTSMASPPLDPGDAYDAFFVFCTDAPEYLMTGAMHGQLDLDQLTERPSCMPPPRAAH